MGEIIKKPWTEIPDGAKVATSEALVERARTPEDFEIYQLDAWRWCLRRYLAPQDPDGDIEIYQLPYWPMRMLEIGMETGRDAARMKMREALGMEE